MLAASMRMISSQVRYAISGIFDLAYNADSEPVQLRRIGERQQIPPRYLEQIFQRLRRGGLVVGKRGPGGGYLIARSPSEITLLEILEAVEGSIGENRDGDDAGSGLTALAACDYRPDFLWAELAQRIGDVLSSTTLEDLCQQAARKGVSRSRAGMFNYEI